MKCGNKDTIKIGQSFSLPYDPYQYAPNIKWKRMIARMVRVPTERYPTPFKKNARWESDLTRAMGGEFWHSVMC